MPDKILGIYTIQKNNDANSITIPSTSGLNTGDSVVRVLKSDGNLEIRRSKTNFWENAPVMTKKEKEEELEELGYNPIEQFPQGNERITDTELPKTRWFNIYAYYSDYYIINSINMYP